MVLWEGRRRLLDCKEAAADAVRESGGQGGQQGVDPGVEAEGLEGDLDRDVGVRVLGHGQVIEPGDTGTGKG